jgi:hypothetical protein
MEPYEVTQYTSRTHRAPFGRSLPASGRETARPSQVSWFGWHGRFLVPAIRSMSADGAAGSRIAEGNRHRQREASLKRTIHPCDHGVTAGMIHGLAHGLPGLLRRTRKFSAGDQKRLDPEHSRYGERGGGPSAPTLRDQYFLTIPESLLRALLSWVSFMVLGYALGIQGAQFRINRSRLIVHGHPSPGTCPRAIHRSLIGRTKIL